MPCVLHHVSRSSVSERREAIMKPRASGTSATIASMAARNSSGRATELRRPATKSSAPPYTRP
eukprot:scaffold100641_cov31-Tisochrysis_lutea.AAC.1